MKTDLGFVDHGAALAVYPTGSTLAGKLVVAGTVGPESNATNSFAVARYNIDGTLDSGFATTGKATISLSGGYDRATAVLIQPDDKIIVVGQANNGLEIGLVRYNADGTLDTSFGSGGKVRRTEGNWYGGWNAAVLQTDGNIAVAGQRYDTSVTDSVSSTVVRFGPTGAYLGTWKVDFAGTYWVDIGGGTMQEFVSYEGFSGLTAQSDGKLVAVGYANTKTGNRAVMTAARFLLNGGLDTTFNATGKATVSYSATFSDYANGVAIQSDGKVVMGGRAGISDSVNNFAIARLTAAGAPDTGFNATGRATVDAGGANEGNAVALQPDGKILVAGYGTNFGITRFTSGGSVDTGFGTSGVVNVSFGSDDRAYAVAVQSDGKIVMAGWSGSGLTRDFALARLYAASTAMMYCSNAETQITDLIAPGATGDILKIAVRTGGDLSPLSASSFVFTTTGTTSVADIASAKLYFTGSSPTFSTATQVGSTVNAPNGSFTISGTPQLVEGANYFWLAYAIAAAAPVGNVADAGCTGITLSSGSITPTTQYPAGSRTISNILAIYDIASHVPKGSDPDSVPAGNLAPGLTASSLTAGSGINADTYYTATGVYTYYNWTGSSTRDANDYFQAIITPDAGKKITYSRLRFGVATDNWDAQFKGPTKIDLRYSTDGFVSSDVLLATLTLAPTDIFQQMVIDQDVSAVGTLTGTVTFRLYGYNRLGTDATSGMALVNTAATGDYSGAGSNMIFTGTVGSTKADTTTAIASHPPNPSVVGQPVTVSYSVSGPGTPTGNVTVSDGIGDSCVAPVATGSCSITPTSTGSPLTLTATYEGDTGFNGSVSAGVSHTVNKADTSTTITSDLPDPSLVGAAVPVNFGIAVTAPGAGTPTGSVTVSSGTDSCVGTVAAGFCSITLTTAGAMTLTANYAGDTKFNGSSSTGESHTVHQAPAITSANNSTFVVGSAGTFTITTTGVPTNASMSISETGALPSGVTFTNNSNGTATLAGTPAAGTSGAYSITIAANNGVGSPASQSFTLTVNQAPAITSADNTTFVVGSAGTFTVTTAGFPTNASMSISESGALPGGVTFTNNNNGTATLTGTPAAGTGGTYPITITANNGVAPNATQSFTLTVNQAPAITSANNTTFTVGSAGTFIVTTTAVPTVTTIAGTGALPGGVTLTDNGNGTATLAGTPAAGTGGTYPVTITAGNGIGTDATQPFTLTVNQAPAITSANSATFVVGSAGTFTVTTTGFPSNASMSISESGALPGGVTLTNNNNGTATLAGTPAAGTGGTYPITITANNGVAPNATQSFTLTVNQAPAITSANNTTFTVGSAGTFTITTTGVPTVTTISGTGALPGGVTLTDNGNGTATLAGTPAAGTSGTYPFTITAGNGVGTDVTQSFTLTVTQAPTITSLSTTTFTETIVGTFTVTTAGFPTGASMAIGKTGALPTGVTFTDNGNGTATLAGTPVFGSNGNYPITITADNGVAPNATQSYTLVVQPNLAITSANNSTFVVGSAGSFTVTTVGSPTPSLSKAGVLPSGVTFTDNADGTATLAGTPAAGTGGTFAITITASNGVAPNATQSFTLTVNQAAAITSANSTTFSEGSAGTFTVTTTGFPTGAAMSITTASSLPTGVTITNNNNGTATLAGTPAAGTGGVYPITITAANGVGAAATQSFTLTVNPAVAFSQAASSGQETTTPAAFVVTLSVASGQTVTVNYATASGTATAGSDYSATSGTLTFTPGVTSRTINVPILMDKVEEPDETFTVTLSTPSNATLGPTTSHAYTILGTGAFSAGSIRLSSNAYSVGEGGPTVTITATRTGGSSGAVGVSYTTSNGTATAGSDYTTASGTMSWADADAANKTFAVSISDDALVELNETFTVTLSTPSGGATLSSPGNGTVTINDNELPTVQFGQAASSGPELTTPAAFVVNLSAASGQPVTVAYATANGTATAGGDYTAVFGTLMFSPGVTSRTITVPIIDDKVVEPDETFTVMLSGPSNAALGATSTHTYTIGAGAGPGAAGSIQLGSGAYTVYESGATVTITVMRTGGSSGAVGVSYVTANGTATAGLDYTATSGTLSWADADAASKTFTVPIANDTFAEKFETFTVALPSPTGGATLGRQSSGTVTIFDGTPPADSSGQDGDGDGVVDSADICPTIADASQADADGDGRGDVCDCSWTSMDETHRLSCVGSTETLEACLLEAQADGMHDEIRVMQGLYRGLFTSTPEEAFDLVLAGGYGAGCAKRSLDSALTVLDGDLDGDGVGDGRVLTLDAGSEPAHLQVERISVRNGAVALGDGGCLLLRTGGTAVVDGAELVGCTASDAGGAALVDVGDGSLLVRGSILRGSSAGHGGGLAVRGGTGGVTLLNNTISGNQAQNGGGVSIQGAAAGALELTNNIVWGNSAGVGGDVDVVGFADPAQVMLRANAVAVMETPETWLAPDASSISTDPGFVSADDLHLTRSSPCRDAGDGSNPALGAADINGDQRVIGAGVDIGADEYDTTPR